MTRDFLIQRYCWDNHPRVRGLRPFIATGPRFMEWAAPGSLAKFREWRFRPELRRTIERVFPTAEDKFPEDRRAIAEVLVVDGIVQALWSVDSRECLPRERWLEASIDEVSLEIPYVKPGASNGPYDLGYWVIETLSGLSAPAHFREYVSVDGLTLEEFVPPDVTLIGGLHTAGI